MGIPRERRLVVVKTSGFEGMDLTPQDFFVMSRVEGTPTVGEVIASSGLDAKSAEQSLERLLAAGILSFSAGSTASRRRAPRARPARKKVPSVTVSVDERAKRKRKTDKPTEDAKARRARQLKARFRAMDTSRTTPTSEAPGGASGRPSSRPSSEPGGGRPSSAPGRPSSAPGSDPPKDSGGAAPVIEPVPETDRRLDRTLDLSIDRQRLVLAIHDRLDRSNHFEILQIAPTNDTKSIRRAYHQVSRKLHPDAFYGKKMGPFMDMLTELFKRSKLAYEMLMDDKTREAYVERLLEIEQRKAEGERRREEEARQAEELRAALERQREEMVERRKRDEEARARLARDQERDRRRRVRASGADTRLKKATEHYDNGMRELGEGRYGAAAGLFRLAMDLDPDNPKYHDLWQENLDKAQTSRAERALEAARRLEEIGQPGEAAIYYETAARANPTPANLASAARALAAGSRPDKARDMAMSALDALKSARTSGELSDEEAGAVHMDCARAFLAAGQPATAMQQAEQAKALIPKSQELDALLKSLKVT